MEEIIRHEVGLYTGRSRIVAQVSRTPLKGSDEGVYPGKIVLQVDIAAYHSCNCSDALVPRPWIIGCIGQASRLFPFMSRQVHARIHAINLEFACGIVESHNYKSSTFLNSQCCFNNEPLAVFYFVLDSNFFSK